MSSRVHLLRRHRTRHDLRVTPVDVCWWQSDDSRASGTRYRFLPRIAQSEAEVRTSVTRIPVGGSRSGYRSVAHEVALTTAYNLIFDCLIRTASKTGALTHHPTFQSCGEKSSKPPQSDPTLNVLETQKDTSLCLAGLIEILRNPDQAPVSAITPRTSLLPAETVGFQLLSLRQLALIRY